MMEGKKIVEHAIISEDEDEEEAFSLIVNTPASLMNDINTMLECYLNLPEIPDPAHSPLSFACLHE